MGRMRGLFSEDDWVTPNNINRQLMAELFKGTHAQVQSKGKELVSLGWRFYVVNQTRGRCYYKPKMITIPAWVFSRSEPGYKDWYLSHEMAHAQVWNDGIRGEVHGPRFMAALIAICPEEFCKYELGYKPRNAMAAGITEKGLKKPKDDLSDLFD